MPYRSSDSKERRRRELAAELSRARELTDPAARRAAEAQALSALRDLELPRQKRSLPTFSLLPLVRIASPCTESWDAMEGDERVRHCSRCERDVFHLSAMTRAEVEALLAAHHALPEGDLPCVRFYRRSDGTILTADCPVGAPRKHALQLAATAAVAITALVAATVGTPEASRPTGRPPPPPSPPPRGVRPHRWGVGNALERGARCPAGSGRGDEGGVLPRGSHGAVGPHERPRERGCSRGPRRRSAQSRPTRACEHGGRRHRHPHDQATATTRRPTRPS